MAVTSQTWNGAARIDFATIRRLAHWRLAIDATSHPHHGRR